MAAYRFYNLTVRSPISLPGVHVPAAASDVEVRIANLPDVRARFRGASDAVQVEQREVRFFWAEIGTLVVRGGREILVDPASNADERWLRIALLGPAFAALLQQRGFLILHASAIAVAGEAVAFVGASGWGKSTMAASLHGRGYDLVTDDIAAVECRADGAYIHPGFPQFKLWPDTLSRLGVDATALDHLNPIMDKRVRPVETGFHSGDALALHSIYLLERGDRIRVQAVSEREAFLVLLSHSYGIEWLHPVSGPSHFLTRSELARRVAVRRLVRPFDLDRLDEVIGVLEADLAAAC